MLCKVSSVERTPLFAFQLAKVNRSSLSVPHNAMTFYTVANLSKPSSVLIISPLISLMNSQVHDLRKRNQSALRLSADASTDEQSWLMCGNISYVFSAPEALDEERWKAALRSSKGLKVRAVFCDGSHCIEMWGGGVKPFRQSYAKIASL